MAAPRLASGSHLTTDDQLTLYREQMGREAVDRQQLAALREQGRCTCEPQSVLRRWEGGDRPTRRRVHASSCPRRKPWMEGV